jgi:hypothetical protein
LLKERSQRQRQVKGKVEETLRGGLEVCKQ